MEEVIESKEIQEQKNEIPKLFLFGAGFTLIIFIILGAFILGKNEGKKSLNKSAAVTPTPTIDPLSYWQNYQDTIDNFYTVRFPEKWFVTTDPESHCATFSDIENPNDIPVKIPVENHNIIRFCYQVGEAPKTFSFANGSSDNPTIKKYSLDKVLGIRGEMTSTIGMGELIIIPSSKTGYISIQRLAGDKKTFDQILSTFKFTR